MRRYHIENFGCRATQADGAALERQFEDRGLIGSSASDADVVVLNTCTVTAAADQDARAAMRRIQRQNPKARIVVTGCYAQRAPEEIASLPGVSLVVGNSHKNQLAELVTGIPTGSEALAPGSFIPIDALQQRREPASGNPGALLFVSDIFAHTELLAAPVFSAANERTRPNLKVQDGCDNRCSFCVIPYVRGQSRSLPLARIINQVNLLVSEGYCELVISGINLGRWGRDLQLESNSQKAPRFEDLIRTILAETDLQKLRISSVEPMDWSDELIALVSDSPRIAKHAHVPMQSGSDSVLRRMHRKYRPWHYRQKIEKIREAMPNAAIGADVMVGFPGETDRGFSETLQMVQDLPFTYLHVFTYSARPGTPAAAMRNQLPVSVTRERNRALRELAAEKKRRFMGGILGHTLDAITLRTEKDETACEQSAHARKQSFTECLTDNYLKLHLEGCHPPNQWHRVRVTGIQDDALVAAETS